jgi:hypothetical protein
MKRIILTLLLLLVCGGAWAESVGGYDVERLATAIYHAEGGANTRHPYGILAKYKTTTPRQACINTIRSKHREWVALGAKGDYLRYLQSRYAPIGASNDPTGLNAHWLGNVARLYEKGA